MIYDFIVAHASLMYELLTVFLLLGLVIFFCGALVSRVDKIPLHEGVYFAFLTAFTVGLGDVVPKSHFSRFITVILSFLGLLLVGVLVGITVHALDVAM